MTARRLPFRTVVIALLVAVTCASCNLFVVGPNGPRPFRTPDSSGRWFTDAGGRVVMLRGVNFVQKSPPFHPAAVGFDDDDAAFLADHGFNTVRLGVVFEALMPEPGEIAADYIEALAGTVDILDDHGISVLIDFHQDGYGPATHGNGMPAWATITDGLPNPPVGFPLYYVQNPALQRAFDNFWANRDGPDGVPLQTHYAAGMRAVAARFADAPNVIGYQPMNEPWPGTEWSPCLSGCPDIEQERLVPFHARMLQAVRSVDPDGRVFAEPFALFNFGSADTSLPGSGALAGRHALSTHVYATDAAADLSVMMRSVAAAERDGAPLLTTEWGATNDPARLGRTADQFDSQLLPWLFWAYNENVIIDTRRPPSPDNVRVAVVDALTRPFPSAINGTPTRIAFDDASDTLEFEYSTTRPDGGPGSAVLPTVVNVPRSRYPDGYTVTVTGAEVVSEPCARAVRLRALPGATSVAVRIAPGTCP